MNNGTLQKEIDLRVKDPVLHVIVRVGCLFTSFVPVAFNLAEQAVLILLRALLDLLAASIHIA